MYVSFREIYYYYWIIIRIRFRRIVVKHTHPGIKIDSRPHGRYEMTLLQINDNIISNLRNRAINRPVTTNRLKRFVRVLITDNIL